MTETIPEPVPDEPQAINENVSPAAHEVLEGSDWATGGRRDPNVQPDGGGAGLVP